MENHLSWKCYTVPKDLKDLEASLDDDIDRILDNDDPLDFVNVIMSMPRREIMFDKGWNGEIHWVVMCQNCVIASGYAKPERVCYIAGDKTLNMPPVIRFGDVRIRLAKD